MSELVFIAPGRLHQLTGGYIYDRHVIEGLRSRGYTVRVIELAPNNRTKALAELADGATAIIDGLALPDLDQAIVTHWQRLQLVALVHHPLAKETGLSRAAAERLGLLEAAVLQYFCGVLCPAQRQPPHCELMVLRPTAYSWSRRAPQSLAGLCALAAAGFARCCASPA